MKNSKVTMAIFSGLMALAVQGYGQNVFQVTIKGTCLTTNDAGAIVSTKLSNQTFINDAVTGTGATNSSGLTLVYVQNASSDPNTPGDFIEVVSATNGTPVYTNLQFMYNGAFLPALISPDQTQFAAGAAVIPLPLAGAGDSLGGATINGRALARKTVISGSFDYTSLRSPLSTSNDIVRICSGTFNAGKLFVPKQR
jgi:hypothetical protein